MSNGGIPDDVFTDKQSSSTKRIKVEEGYTAFDNGRQFKISKALSLTNNQVYLLKISSLTDFNLDKLLMTLTAGKVTVEFFKSVTSTTGTFSETLNVIPRNIKSTVKAYTSQITATAVPTGGTTTGGTLIDYMYIAAANSVDVDSFVQSAEIDVLGLCAGDYYLKITAGANGTTGVMRVDWSEE